MQCRTLVAQLGRHYSELQAQNAEVIVILGDRPELAKRYASQLKLPFPVAADPKRSVYHRYGLEKSMLLQRTAAVVVDRAGIVRYLHRTTNPLPWLNEFRALFQAVQELNQAPE